MLNLDSSINFSKTLNAEQTAKLSKILGDYSYLDMQDKCKVYHKALSLISQRIEFSEMLLLLSDADADELGLYCNEILHEEAMKDEADDGKTPFEKMIEAEID